jgi:glycosyltransferase involved in cell wall biosynthesis
MSTYQGELFVREQIASILAQLPAQGRLMIRDDGSTDATCGLIEAMGDPRISLVRGQNIGFARSFLWLLAAAPKDLDMVMLSDQDDVWLSDKIERAWNEVGRAASAPLLYCSRVRLVDEGLRPIGVSIKPPRGPSFHNALAENIVIGCTTAMNPAAHALVLNVGDASRIQFHDWWIYLVVSAFGKVVMDDEPTLLYRQHANNVIGRGAGIGRYLRNLAFVRKRSWVHIMFSQIENFRQVHAAALPAEKRRLLDGSFNARRGWSMARLICFPARHRQLLLDELLLRLLIVCEIVLGRGLLPK